MCNPDDDTPTAPDTYNDVEISVADTAARLSCSAGVAYDWIKTGKLAVCREAGRWLCLPSAAGSASPRPSAFSLNIAPA